MPVRILRPCMSFAIGQVVNLSTDLEASLIATGIAQAATFAQLTLGTERLEGLAAGTVLLAAGSISKTVLNSAIDANSRVFGMLSGANTDTTALYIARIASSPGQFIIVMNAIATANVQIDFYIVPSNLSYINKTV